ncbi:MAG: SPASM domain-containing protein [Candidatus Omnitrophota bacterium]|nr:SPASM domain-containing protein [Candidatus Omnitrophota bacterium]
MGVHQFKILHKSLAVDIESGNFFETDDVISDAIMLMPSHVKKEVEGKLSGKYPGRKLNGLIDKLYDLKKRRALFSPPCRKKEKLSRKITDLTLNITDHCNLRCKYCWNQAGTYGDSLSGGSKMRRETAFKAVDLLIKESGAAPDLVVDFYGGEPLANFSLIKDVVYYCKEINKKRKKKINFRFLLATNGTLLSKEIGEFLIDNNVDIAVSLDGPQSIQDAQRPFLDGRGSFNTIMNNLRSLSKDYRKRIVGRATFTPYSMDVIKTFKFLSNLGFDRIEICESEKAGYGLETDTQSFFCGKEGVEKLKGIYEKLAVFYTKGILSGRLTYDNTYFNRFFKQLSRLYHIQSVVGTCSAGFSLMAVGQSGTIYPCTAFVGVPQFEIGSVDTGIDEKKLNAFLNIRICSSKSCEKCWAKRICMGCGSCYNLNYFTGKDAKEPNPYYCELFRHKTKLMMGMIAEISGKKNRLLDEVLIPEFYAARGRRKH